MNVDGGIVQNSTLLHLFKQFHISLSDGLQALPSSDFPNILIRIPALVDYLAPARPGG